MTQASNSCITATHIQKHIKVGFWGRKKHILQNISFNVPKGKIVGFVGPNGAGKSTTIKSLGAMRPNAGKISLLDSSPTDIHAKARIGYLPEIQNLPKTLKPIELLRLHARLSRKQGLDNKEHLLTLLEDVGLAEQALQPMKGFSKGQQQRVGLALALCHEPELLILDEPMTGLDPIGRSIVRQIILKQKALGHTVFFSSHILSDVEALCDEVIIIDKGQTRQQGPLKKLLQHRGLDYEIIVNASPDTIQALLPKQTAPLQRGESSLIRAKSQQELMAILKELDQAAIPITKVEETKLSLEDLLLHARNRSQ